MKAEINELWEGWIRKQWQLDSHSAG